MLAPAGAYCQVVRHQVSEYLQLIGALGVILLGLGVIVDSVMAVRQARRRAKEIVDEFSAYIDKIESDRQLATARQRRRERRERRELYNLIHGLMEPH